MRILGWLVLLPLWRRVTSDSRWHVPAALGTGIAWVVIIIIIAVASGGGDDDSGASAQDQDTPEPGITATAEAEPIEVAPDPTEPPPEEAEIDDLAAEGAYLDGLVSVTDDVALILGNVGSLGVESPTELLGEDWFRDLGREQDRLNNAQSTFLALQPAPQYTETHRLVTQALNEMDIALDLFEAGGRAVDATKIEEALAHMQEATRFISEAIVALPE